MFEGLLFLKARKKFINLSEFVLQIYKEETEMSEIAIILWSINIKQLMHKLQGLFYRMIDCTANMYNVLTAFVRHKRCTLSFTTPNCGIILFVVLHYTYSATKCRNNYDNSVVQS